MQQKATKKCKNPDCGRDFRIYRSTDKYCSAKCFNSMVKSGVQKKHTIKPIGDKKLAELEIYSKERKEFLSLPENKTCPVTGQKATEIHHKKGRIGYADDWARQNNISLLIDKRFFLAVSRDGHRKIEENPHWAKDNGFSLSRLKNEM